MGFHWTKNKDHFINVLKPLPSIEAYVHLLKFSDIFFPPQSSDTHMVKQ